MDIIVDKVYDKQRFAHFIHLKYKYPLSYTRIRSERINNYDKHMLTNLSESEVRYLQGPMNDCSHDRPRICNLKIINNMNNERKSFEQKIEEIFNESQVYSVTYIELVKHESTMTKQEIDKLLVNPRVKSINIIKE